MAADMILQQQAPHPQEVELVNQIEIITKGQLIDPSLTLADPLT